MGFSVSLGLLLGRGQKTLGDFFLSGRSLPWWVLLFSIVAAETSTVTFLSLPGLSFAESTPESPGGNLCFLQIAFGYVVGRALVVMFLLPLYFKGNAVTAYEVLQKRFGKGLRRCTAALFLCTRNLSDGLRLFLTALVLREAVGIEMDYSVILLGGITVAYTYAGGMKSVAWNDLIQFVVYIAGAVGALWVITQHLPGGMEQIVSFAHETQRDRLLDFDFSLSKGTMTFWAGLFGGIFLTGATHGTDQLMVQRYLSARSQRDAGRALFLSGLVVLLQFALFLWIGVALACFYDSNPPETAFAAGEGDRVFAHFIVNSLGVGLRGITLAAVFAAAMSTLSGSLSSSASAFVNDLYLPLRGSSGGEGEGASVGRYSTAGFGVLQIVIAIAAAHLGGGESTVRSVLAIAGFAAGPVLGLYLLAVLEPRCNEANAAIGLLVGIVVLTTVSAFGLVSWPWFPMIGAMTAFLVGKALSFLQTQHE